MLICGRSTQIHSFSWFLEEKLKLALSEIIKIGMKKEMGVANKMTSSVLDREHAACAFAHKKHANQLVFNGMWRKKAARIVIGP